MIPSELVCEGCGRAWGAIEAGYGHSPDCAQMGAPPAGADVSQLALSPLDRAAIAALTARDAVWERDKAIRWARNNGATFAQIAEAVGLTAPGVRRVCTRG